MTTKTSEKIRFLFEAGIEHANNPQFVYRPPAMTPEEEAKAEEDLRVFNISLKELLEEEEVDE